MLTRMGGQQNKGRLPSLFRSWRSPRSFVLFERDALPLTDEVEYVRWVSVCSGDRLRTYL